MSPNRALIPQLIEQSLARGREWNLLIHHAVARLGVADRLQQIRAPTRVCVAQPDDVVSTIPAQISAFVRRRQTILDF